MEDDPDLLTRLAPVGHEAKPERAIVIRVSARDANGPQHIPQRLQAGDVEAALGA